VQQPGALKPFLLQVRPLDPYARISVAKDRAAAGSVLDKNIGESALCVGHPTKMRLYADIA
jgi:hypothetical protein